MIKKEIYNNLINIKTIILNDKEADRKWLSWFSEDDLFTRAPTHWNTTEEYLSFGG